MLSSPHFQHTLSGKVESTSSCSCFMTRGFVARLWAKKVRELLVVSYPAKRKIIAWERISWSLKPGEGRRSHDLEYIWVVFSCVCRYVLVHMRVTFILFYSTGVIVFLGVNHELKEIHPTLKVDIQKNSLDSLSKAVDTSTNTHKHTHTVILFACWFLD